MSLPDEVKTRSAERFTYDRDGEVDGRSTVDVPARHAWKIASLSTREITWAPMGEEKVDRIVVLLFSRPDDKAFTHTISKIGADGTVIAGPIPV